MAFVFDATIGGASANSYLTVAQADDYFDSRYDNELYTDLTDEEKQRLLVTASRRLDAEHYAGRSVTETQALQFPRVVAYDRNYYPYQQNEIPVNLKNAVCELGYFYLQKDDRMLDETELHDAAMLENYKVGPLQYGFRNNAKMDQLPETVKKQLRAIGYSVWLGEVTATRMRL